MFIKCATEAEYVVQAPAQSADAANFVSHMMWQLCVPCACVRFYFFLVLVVVVVVKLVL